MPKFILPMLSQFRINHGVREGRNLKDAWRERTLGQGAICGRIVSID